MVKVGDTIWCFDINRRRYQGEGLSKTIIYSEHFDPFEITGETKQSGLVEKYGCVRKINKKTMAEANGKYMPYQWYTEKGMEENIWIKNHRPNISSQVLGVYDVDKLRRIQAILEEE